MKYWLFQNNQVTGPFDLDQLAQAKGFSADALVCPEGKKGTEMGDWKRASTVPELSELIQKGPAVATATHHPAPTTLPPEPTLQNLAHLGNLQEKFSLLESSIAQLREDLRIRDTEIDHLKTDLSQREKDISQLQSKNSDLESKVGQIQDLQNRFHQTREELRGEISKAEEDRRTAAMKLSDLERRLQETQTNMAPAPAANPFSPAVAPPGAPAWETPRPQMSLSPPPMSAPAQETKPIVFEPALQPLQAGSESSRGLTELRDIETESATGLVDVRGPKKKRGGIFFVIMGLALFATGGVYFMSQDGRKWIAKYRSLASNINVSESPKTVPQVNAVPALDYSRVAEDFAKQYRIPGVGMTLEQRLEGTFPPTGNLSPWFPQKLDDGKYQVNFYVRGTPLVYQFLVEPRESRLSGINPAAIAVLRGEAPAVPPAASKRRVSAKKPRIRRSKLRVGKAGRGSSGDTNLTPPPPAAETPVETNLAEPKPAESNAAPQPQEKESSSSSEDNSNLSDMLLPGVPKRSR